MHKARFYLAFSRKTSSSRDGLPIRPRYYILYLQGRYAMNKEKPYPKRRPLPHRMPSWIGDRNIYFITICALPRGYNQLCKNELSESLWESVLYREKSGQWLVHYFLLMPDHLHGLFSFNATYGLEGSITAWKRYTASKFHIKWQRDFFDHRLRSDESLEHKIEYIAMNPVRKEFVTKSEDWPYAWGFR